MTVLTQRPAPAPASGAEAPAGRRRRQGRWGDRLLYGYTWLIILWLCLPIGVMILFGFNDTKGKYNQSWSGFTVKWYGRLLEYPDLTQALLNSLLVAVLCTLISGALGTMVGLALGKYRFRGQGVANLVMFATISAPEIIMGASLLSFFVQAYFPLGFATMVTRLSCSARFSAISWVRSLLGPIARTTSS